ncbi:SDR family NAD(P)-dependent oxidoreductase [Microbacterium sp. A93]|uniref:SDR family NAD(P)-dependent oxidoreductase n=1 Tax=Microbacterium sp. A93 TaxID=3450716 RepID=UPI003F4357E2
MMTEDKRGVRSLEGTVALVTGASSGIGEATARALAHEGAAVVVIGRRTERLHQLVAKIEESGTRALAAPADVSQRDQLEAAVAAGVDAFGGIDTVVTCAGRGLLAPVEGADPNEWDEMIATNLRGVLNTIHIALPHLLEAAERGRRGVADIVNISSVAGRLARRDYAVYSMTKFGVNAFTESLRAEFAKRHVRASVVEPGAVDTEFASHVSAKTLAAMQSRVGGMEWLRAEDVADAVRYIVTRPRHVAVNEVLIRPTEQET